MLQLHHLLDAVRDEVFDRLLIAKPVAARHRVVEVIVEAVVGAHNAGRTAFGGDRMTAHRHDLRNQRNAKLRVALVDSDGCAQACASAAYNDDIRFDDLHLDPKAGYRVEVGSRWSQAKSDCPSNP